MPSGRRRRARGGGAGGGSDSDDASLEAGDAGMSPPSPAGGGSNKWRPGLSGAAAKARAKELRKAGEARAAAARLAKRERQAAVPRRSSKAERRRAAAAGAAAADAAAGELRRLSVARGTADHGPNHAAPESTKERVLASALLPDVLWQRVLGEAGARACCAAARSCTDLRRAACARGVWDALARGVFGDARDTFANGGAHSAAAGRRDAQARRRSEEDVTTSELRRAVRRSELRAAAWEGLASGRHTDEARWGDVGGLSASTLWQDGTVGLAAEGRQLRLFEVCARAHSRAHMDALRRVGAHASRARWKTRRVLTARRNPLS